MFGTNHTRRARPDGFTAGPGRYTSTGQLHLPGVDVSVTMVDKVQQSMLEKLEVPRIQFLDRWVDIPVGLHWRCTVHTVQRTVEFHRSSSLVWC